MEKITNLFIALGLDVDYFNHVAANTKFKSRFRVMNGIDYVLVLLINISNTVISYNTLASSFINNPTKSISKQALHKALSKKTFVKFIEQIINDLLLSKLTTSKGDLRSRFKRIIIQDSTIIKLPKRLFPDYSGVKNGFVQVANARLQFALNLLTNSLIHFSLDSYSVNDIAAKLLNITNRDLLLRDRGYFSIKEIIRILKAKADFIYRYKHKIVYYDIKSGKPIDLLKVLNKTYITDIMVRISSPNGPMVRLIAIPVCNNLANHRRASLKKSSKSTPQKDLLALLSWSIFITSIKDEDINYDEIYKLYKLRWRIEILFKALKSHLKLNHIHNVSKIQLEFIILTKIMMIILVLQFIYEPLYRPIKHLYDRDLSILKTINYLMNNKSTIYDLQEKTQEKLIKDSDMLKKFANNCSYEKRQDRTNFNEDFEFVFD
ncbi:MAG: IS4 family transposase [Bacteroidota bacterium]|nr:IS4 family transposase [Bacteroidota bacterium]